MADRLSRAEARRLALSAQGFGRAHPAVAGTRQLNALLQRLRVLQIDSVNVFSRSHYLPVLARLGAYDRAALDALTMRQQSAYTEYWAHEAAFVPKADLGLFAFRQRFYRERYSGWRAEHHDVVDVVLGELAERGPMPAGDVEHESNRRRGGWWGWSDMKTAFEVLFLQGDLVTAGRQGFQRRYALPHQVYPAGPPEAVDESDAVRELVRRAVVAHGVGTVRDIADYYRLAIAPTLRALRELEDAGRIAPVEVEGWLRGAKPLPAWRDPAASIPRRIDATALLSPFDPLVWQRDRAERLFGFRYRIEIYTPEAKRVHGYYVLPALVDDALVGRIDLKADRQAGTLLVQASWIEPDAPADVAERLAPVLARAAAWQGLDEVRVMPKGDLAPALTSAVVAGGWMT